MIAIAAHPGDAVFTMGAAVAQHVAGGGAGVLVSLSLGEKGAPQGTAVAAYADVQRAASEKAARILGAKFELLTHPDGQIPLSDEVALEVADLIRKHKGAIVITHWDGSWHKDHQHCHLIVRDAVFYAGLRTLERPYEPQSVRKLFFADNWEDADHFKPDTYLDISAVYDKWMAACAAYPMWRGETGFRYNDYYSSLAVMRGCLSGVKYAVALKAAEQDFFRALKSL